MRHTLWNALVYLAVVGMPASAGQVSVSPGHDVDRSFNVALGVECSHCHAGTSWRDASAPAYRTARQMVAMRAFLERGALAGTAGVTCWSCHRGQRRPPRVPTEAWELIQATRFVGPLATVPEDVQLTMAVYSASLGVECAHCHVPDQWTATSRPTHATTRRMSEMITTLGPFLPPGARTQCFMCHQGQPRPARRP